MELCNKINKKYHNSNNKKDPYCPYSRVPLAADYRIKGPTLNSVEVICTGVEVSVRDQNRHEVKGTMAPCDAVDSRVIYDNLPRWWLVITSHLWKEGGRRPLVYDPMLGCGPEAVGRPGSHLHRCGELASPAWYRAGKETHIHKTCENNTNNINNYGLFPRAPGQPEKMTPEQGGVLANFSLDDFQKSNGQGK